MRLLISIFLVFVAERPFAQVDSTFRDSTSVETVYDHPEVPAKFSGGDNALMKYISDNLKTLGCTDGLTVSGKTLYAKFKINKDGSISDISFPKNAGGQPETWEERAFKKALEKMPKWEPAMIGGEPVDSWSHLPLRIALK